MAAPTPELENPGLIKRVYLTTLVHPSSGINSDVIVLVTPVRLSREDVRDKILDSCANPVYADLGNQARGGGEIPVVCPCVQVHACSATAR